MEEYELLDSQEDRFQRILESGILKEFPELESDIDTLRMYMSIKFSGLTAMKALRRHIDLADDKEFIKFIDQLSKDKGFGRASEQNEN